MSKKTKSRVLVEEESIEDIFLANGVEFIPETKPERPTSVRIFGKEYAINYVPPHAGMEDYGKIDFHNSLINVQEYQLSYEEADTLLHEVVHGIDSVMDLKLSEHQVQALSSGLMGVFQDNPEYAKFIIFPRPLGTDKI